MGLGDLGLINLQEVVKHLNLAVTLFSLVKGVVSRSHLPADSVDLVSPLLTIVSHDDSAIEIAVDPLLILKTVEAIVYNC